MAYLNDWRKRFQVGLPSASPFSSIGLVWCSRCKTSVDHDTKAVHQRGVYAWKQWCLRCGKVISKGVYENVPLFSAVQSQAMTLAIDWSRTNEADRR